MLNVCFLHGRLTRDPEFNQTTNGIPYCRFSVAVNRPKNKDGEQEADFFDCTAWRGTAEFIARYFTKGSGIIVEGCLRNNNYVDNNGVKHYSMSIMVKNVDFAERANSDNSNGQAQQVHSQYQSVSNAAQSSQTQQNAGYNAMNDTTRQASAPTPIEQQLDLSEFEEILSDGEVPF